MHGFLLSVGFYLTLEEGQMEKLFSPTKNNHNQNRKSYIKIDDVLQPSPAPRFERTPASLPTAPLGPGHNNNEILSDIGFSDRDINMIFMEIK